MAMVVLDRGSEEHLGFGFKYTKGTDNIILPWLYVPLPHFPE
jgi:hypothetical protein